MNIVGLLLTLLRISLESTPSASYCDGREDGTQCFGALGGTVIIQLMNNTPEILKYQWKNKTLVILRGNGYDFSQYSPENRFFFFPSNGTVRINNLSITDCGKYTLDIFDSKGRNTESRALQLIVQAPVSSVLLVTECLFRLEMKVSCLSETGDSPQYSWTLDGHNLTDSEVLSANNENNVIILRQYVSGYLACSVRNHISLGFTEQIISICKESTASESYCDGRKDGAQCFGALGGTMIIQLMNNTPEILKYQWKNKTSPTLRGKMYNFFPNSLKNKSIFISSNVTISIKNLSKTDSDEYTLEIIDSEGQKTRQTLQLIVQAPVSSVQLVSECLSQLEMKVSCLPERGDSPQYSWTLDGQTLTDSVVLSGHKETNVIVLKQHVSGHLVCSVRNHISHASEEKNLFVCKDASLLIHGLLFAATILSCAGICLYFKLKDKYDKEFVAPLSKKTPEHFKVFEHSRLSHD
ncbi:hypothetical protein ILYODFUR_014362 [Ilyodon furcidens]|uniref:Uncharacterized protein n=1 Tax=Ilyodon furcidens TaxID=33524 RepID=A0ABV0T802_9TELE